MVCGRHFTMPNKTNPGTYSYKGKELTLQELLKLPECKCGYNALAVRLCRRFATGRTIEQCVTITPKQMKKEAMMMRSLNLKHQEGRQPKKKPTKKTVDTSVGDMWKVPESFKLESVCGKRD